MFSFLGIDDDCLTSVTDSLLAFGFLYHIDKAFFLEYYYLSDEVIFAHVGKLFFVAELGEDLLQVVDRLVFCELTHSLCIFFPILQGLLV